MNKIMEQNPYGKAIKGITFVVEEGDGLTLKTLGVNLHRLTGTARTLVELICTTENYDDLSIVYVRNSKTNEELYREEGKIAEEINLVREIFGEEILNTYPTIIWKWDLKSCYETPENYFKRHAAMIDKLGGNVVI